MAIKTITWEVPSRMKQDRLLKFFRKFIVDSMALYLGEQTTEAEQKLINVGKEFERMLKYYLILVCNYPTNIVSSLELIDTEHLNMVDSDKRFISIRNGKQIVRLFHFREDTKEILLGGGEFSDASKISDAELSNHIWTVIHDLFSPVKVLLMGGTEKSKRIIIGYSNDDVADLNIALSALLGSLIKTGAFDTAPNVNEKSWGLVNSFFRAFLGSLSRAYKQRNMDASLFTRKFDVVSENDSFVFKGINGNKLTLQLKFSQYEQQDLIVLKWITPEDTVTQNAVLYQTDAFEKLKQEWFKQAVTEIVLYLTSPFFDSNKI